MLKKTNEIVNVRYDMVCLMSFTHTLPQGDPDSGNSPRVDPETGHGLMTDSGFKRHLRDFLSYKGFPILMARQGIIEVAVEEQAAKVDVDMAAHKGKTFKGTAEEKRQQFQTVINAMAQQYIDFRSFGGVFTAPINEGVSGPVQVSMSVSVDPVLSMALAITRQTAASRERFAKNEAREMGTKHLVPFGLYRNSISVNPFLAKRTGFTEQDLFTLVAAMFKMFEVTASSTRPQAAVEKVIIFKHGNEHGRYPRQKLVDMVQVKRTDPLAPPRKMEDYTISISTEDRNLLGSRDIKILELDGTEDYIQSFFG
jgi:CRISPR-associated protein Csd2